MAAALLDEFGTLPGVLAGSRGRLRRVTNNDHVVEALHTFRAAARHALEAKLSGVTLLNTHMRIVDYLCMDMAYLTHERVRVLYLDVRGHLIRNERVCDGDLSRADMPVRTIVGRAIELGAANLVLAHNHPSGNLKPSSGDQRITSDIEHAAQMFGIRLVAHFIVSREGYAVVGNRGLVLLRSSAAKSW